jgi:hypothetical protein
MFLPLLRHYKEASSNYIEHCKKYDSAYANKPLMHKQMQKYSKPNAQCYKSIPLDDITCLSRYTAVKGFRNKGYSYEKVEMMRRYVY